MPATQIGLTSDGTPLHEFECGNCGAKTTDEIEGPGSHPKGWYWVSDGYGGDYACSSDCLVAVAHGLPHEPSHEPEPE